MFNLKRFVPLQRQIIGKSRIFVYNIRRNQLVKALLAIFLVAFIAAVAVTMLEHHPGSPFSNVGEGLWWAMVTMTTVGYGDLVPGTLAGRFIAAVVMLSGIALVSVFTAALSSRVITDRLKEGRGLSKVNARNHIAILGWNSSGEDIIRMVREDAIRENRSIVLVNQLRQEDMEPVIHKYHELHIKFVYGDPTEEAVLKRANIAFAYAAIIIPDDSAATNQMSDEKTILTTLTVKSIEPKVKVIAHILDASNEVHLKRANADQVVVNNRYSGYLLGAHVTTPGIPAVFDMLLRADGGIRLARRRIPHAFVGKTFSDLSQHFKNTDDAVLLGFIKEAPAFKLDDVLLDDYSSIDAFIRNKLEAAGKGLAKKAKLEVQLNPPADYKVNDNDIAVVVERVAMTYA